MKIIDEFTGRTLEGRRWSEGLHQAIEAKEGVRIQEENQTLATITLQNYFRLYDKLSGHDRHGADRGDRVHEDLQPRRSSRSRPTARWSAADRNDQVYKTKDGKWSAVEREIAARHAAGQPVLVGTISVEVSELLSDAAAAARDRARRAERAARVRRARGRDDRRGRAGPAPSRSRPTWPAAASTSSSAATPSTARGSSWRSSACAPATRTTRSSSRSSLPKIDATIEADRQRVLDAGGLYIVGTERHESRRIDNQLRGRSGRQGDPGETRFFLSAEDDLIRLFAGDRIYRILDRSARSTSRATRSRSRPGCSRKQIENAQRKVEEQHYLARKHTLEYDDVMNEQRRVIYELRDQVLEGANLSQAREEVASVLERTIEEYTADDYVEDWDLEALLGALGADLPGRRSTPTSSATAASTSRRCRAGHRGRDPPVRRARGASSARS